MTITNAHTHLELGWLAECCPNEDGQDFLPWLTDMTERWRKVAGAGCFAEVYYHKAVESGIQSLLDAGVTHVGDISSTAKSLPLLLQSGLQGAVYIECLTPYPAEVEKRFNMARYLIEEWRPKENGGLKVGLTLHTPYTVHPALWRKALPYVRQENLPLCVHVAESPGEYEWMTGGTGPFAEFSEMRGDPIPVPKKTPIAYLEELGVLDLKPLLVHAVHVTEDDVRRIKASGSAVVHCPRSNQRLRCGRMPLELYLKHDVPVYLGTDSLASTPSLDIREELEAAVRLHEGYVPRAEIEKLLHRPFPA